MVPSCRLQGSWFQLTQGRDTDHLPIALLHLSADEDGTTHPQEAPGVCSAPQHDTRSAGDGRYQLHSCCSNYRQHYRRDSCGKDSRCVRSGQWREKNSTEALWYRSLSVYLGDSMAKHLLGHYWRWLLFLNLCVVAWLCQELRVYFWSSKDLSFLPSSTPFFHSDPYAADSM